MSEMNGHANGHGSSDEDESDVSSEGEMEEDVGEKSDDVASSRRLNGHSKKFDDDDFDESEDDEVEETGKDDCGDDDDDDDDDDNDDGSDSDSAPEDVSFKTGRDAFQEKTQQQQRQIDKSQAAIKEKRRRRDELLKEQKAAKLKKLKESKLSTEFLRTLDSQPPTSTPPVKDRLTESSPAILPEDEGSSEPQQKRKLIPLPNVEGVEFEVVVGNTDADSQIMKKVNRYVKRHVQPKSVPRLSAKKKQSLNAKRNLLKKTRRWGLWNDEKDYVDDVLEAGENFVDEATR